MYRYGNKVDGIISFFLLPESAFFADKTDSETVIASPIVGVVADMPQYDAEKLQEHPVSSGRASGS